MLHIIVPGIAFVLLLVAAGFLFKAIQSGAFNSTVQPAPTTKTNKKKRTP